MTTKTESKEFDPSRWLKRDALELRQIYPLMRGDDPSVAPGPTHEQWPLHTAIKAEIDRGKLTAIRRRNGSAYLQTLVERVDAVAFVKARKDDPEWNPPDDTPDSISFYKFCEKWAAYHVKDKRLTKSDRVARLQKTAEEIWGKDSSLGKPMVAQKILEIFRGDETLQSHRDRDQEISVETIERMIKKQRMQPALPASS